MNLTENAPKRPVRKRESTIFPRFGTREFHRTSPYVPESCNGCAATLQLRGCQAKVRISVWLNCPLLVVLTSTFLLGLQSDASRCVREQGKQPESLRLKRQFIGLRPDITDRRGSWGPQGASVEARLLIEMDYCADSGKMRMEPRILRPERHDCSN
jgi:hypothetical protein